MSMRMKKGRISQMRPFFTAAFDLPEMGLTQSEKNLLQWGRKPTAAQVMLQLELLITVNSVCQY